MKAIASSIPKTLEVGTRLVCADNSGAQWLKCIGVKGGKTTSPGRSKFGLGDQITVRVTKGDHDMRGETYQAVVVRQEKEIERAKGMKVSFEDNAAVLIEGETLMPKGNRLKGVVAREAVERFQSVGKVASKVI